MKKRNIKDSKFYAIVPCFNEEKLIEKFIDELSLKLKSFTNNYCIVAVDDGSIDNTSKIIKEISPNYNLKLVKFSRNFGKESALSAGLKMSKKADLTVILDADFQHPLNVIDKFVEKWEEGYDNIYGVRSRQDQTKIKGFLSKKFYKFYNKLMKINMPENAGDFRLLDKNVVKAINSLPESNRFMKGIYAWVGFQGFSVPYKVDDRQDDTGSRWNYYKLASLAVTGITSFSNVPLRLIFLIGLIMFVFSTFYGVFLIFQIFLGDTHIEGWPTLVLSLTFFSGLQFICLGVIGEYVGRIFNEVKGRPNYVIDINNSINLDKD